MAYVYTREAVPRSWAHLQLKIGGLA
jgi:hypothetical protein